LKLRLRKDNNPGRISAANGAKSQPDGTGWLAALEDRTMTQQVELLNATNVQRVRNGLPALGVHSTLQAAAQKHADWMAANRRMSHTGSGGSSYVQRIYAAGPYPASSGTAENIAWGATTAQSCINMWMSSPGHRASLLRQGYQSAGCGAAQAANGDWYWCGLYGAAAPNDSAPTPEPTPSPPRRSWLDWLLSVLGVQ